MSPITGPDAEPPVLPERVSRPASPLRAELAALYDTCLRRLSRHEAPCRLLLGRLARLLLDHRHYDRLGFTRLGDYTRERLGLAARDVQEAAAVSRALDSLPKTASRFGAGELNWTKARLLASTATATDEQYWLALARRASAVELHRAIQRGREAGRVGTPAVNTPEQRVALCIAADDSTEIDGEPKAEFSIACSRRARALWRSLTLLARRSAGSELAEWQAAEVIAAEALSGADLEASRDAATVADGLSAAASAATGLARDPVRCSLAARGSHLRRPVLRGKSSSPSVAELRALREIRAALRYLRDSSRLGMGTGGGPTGIDEGDAHEVDAALRRVVGSMQQIDGRLGGLLVRFMELELYRDLGFSRSADYFVERLGLSVRKARALLAVERTSRACADELVDAYRTGMISWLRALALLRVVCERNAHAWIRRAREVTLRRLVDEVDWALQQRDALVSQGVMLPPPDGLDLEAGRVQIGAWRDPATADASVRFSGPGSVVILVHQAIHAWRRGQEPPSAAFVRMLQHVADHWQAQPRHRDPVFARDGWRCAVPGCSGRANLHDHHIEYRSRGGSNERSNRISVCWRHHQQGIHGAGAVVRARGRADRGVLWELGCRPGKGPLLRLVGDRYVGHQRP